jgi:hypothetical protein
MGTPQDDASHGHVLRQGLRPASLPGGRLLVVMVVGGILALGLIVWLGTVSQTRRLDIVASLIPQSPERWGVRGRVFLDGQPVPQALMWVIARDAKGNREAPDATTTDEKGGFLIEPVPTMIAGQPVREAVVHARDPSPRPWIRTLLSPPPRGEELLVIGHGPLRRVQVSGWVLVLLPALFFCSLLFAILADGRRWQYVLSIALALLLTAGVLAAISAGLSYVHTHGDRNEILSLGFASLFRGRYVKDVEPEWLFSLSAPREPPRSSEGGAPAPDGEPSSAVVHGFGAPLWVLLLSVVGAGLMTVSILVSQITHRPSFQEPVAVRWHMELIARHQLLILFAPLGAIVVYQLLVMASLATQPVAVAVISLGAGLTLTALLDKAVQAALGFLQGPGGQAYPPSPLQWDGRAQPVAVLAQQPAVEGTLRPTSTLAAPFDPGRQAQ